MKIEKVLKTLRVFHDLKQSELALQLLCSKSYLSEIESGKKSPTLQFIQKYAQIFNLKVFEIIFLAENWDKLEQGEQKEISISSKIMAMINLKSQLRQQQVLMQKLPD
ncbi:helix-turn-helix transcriptional regulator [Iningainema tapete]|uniref:Helix-turn-helix transcriptional regulator n=1 Tax=Iningainema tapete BLCC-T55 TaxID=2748662 RepID=A0A8J6XJV1_9CYAN|nr:helix-turn-helix transcriptional regulator [Iningainema tapete]MBD2778250.1 helix-turn-helix transcriptional regulator [Iningainema tapete BLCC-T55]